MPHRAFWMKNTLKITRLIMQASLITYFKELRNEKRNYSIINKDF